MPDTLIQHNPFQGQGLLGADKKMMRVQDFVGEFTTPELEGLSPLTVTRTGASTKQFSCAGHVWNVEEIHDPNAGTGVGCWLSTMVMIPWLLAHHIDTLKGKSVLELGAGTGINTIVASGKPFEVASTKLSDHLPSLIELARRNVEGNVDAIDVQPEVAILDWTDLERPEERYDLIIASDCVFKQTAASFVEAVRRHLKPGGELLMINPPEPGRPRMDQVIYALRELGEVSLMCTPVEMASDDETRYHKDLLLIHLTDFEDSDREGPLMHD